MGRLDRKNLDKYLLETYGKEGFEEVAKCTIPIRGLNQSEYGDVYDCTLVSIATIVRYYLNYTVETEEIYNYTEEIAKKFLYRGDHWGTFFIVIKSIFDRILRHYGLPASKKQMIYKGCLGYNFKTIKTQIDAMVPIILSMANDGRDYYKNHSVVIMGYRIMKKDDIEVPILVVLDNWTKLVSYIDYNKLSFVSQINF